MKIAIYTSFAINYLAKARVLVDSVKTINPDIDVIGLVNDRFPPGFDIGNERFDQIWMVEDFPADPIKSWIFRHNIMELSTAGKGWALERLLAAGYDYVIYLDPDCWVLEDPAKMIALLPEEFSIGVVPHTTQEADSDEEIRIVETSSMRHGIYNLGFLLVRNDANGKRFAKWWAERLYRYCLDDIPNGIFTDQRWFDLATGYFEFIKVIRHHGIDVASWNIGQRKLERSGDGYLVDGDGLIFYHFSGVGPTGVHRWVREKFAPADPIAAELEFRYEELIAEAGQADLESIPPYFDSYSDGAKVAAAHRLLYRTRPDLMKAFPDPYDVNSRSCFRTIAERETLSAKTPAIEPKIMAGDIDRHALRFFDAEYFRQLRSFSDEISKNALWKKYKRISWRPNVSPNRFFNTALYKGFVSRADVAKYQTPLHHFIAIGIRSGLSPSWIYDETYYLDKYPDVRDAVGAGHIICGFEHFVFSGCEEGRDGCGFFNERAYLAANPEVAVAVAQGSIQSGEAHYLVHGCVEGRPLR